MCLKLVLRCAEEKFNRKPVGITYHDTMVVSSEVSKLGANKAQKSLAGRSSGRLHKWRPPRRLPFKPQFIRFRFSYALVPNEAAHWHTR